MLGPAPIQFSAVSIRQLKFRLALGIAETLPQRYREGGPITGRQFEQFRKRTRRHDSILAWLGTQPQSAPLYSRAPQRTLRGAIRSETIDRDRNPQRDFRCSDRTRDADHEFLDHLLCDTFDSET